MIKLYEKGVYLQDGQVIDETSAAYTEVQREEARRQTIAYRILQKHNHSGNAEKLSIRFDALTSHDITYVGIIQTAKASGLKQFPMPYILTNCHNSLGAVGGTINDDDHVFGLTAAKHYGGIYVPPHMAVIHQFMREKYASCGSMILGSDSHTRYGALGTMAVGEGGGELSKQLLGDYYQLSSPGVIAIYLEGSPKPGIGPMDVALAIIGAVFKNGYVKNKIMEFVGPGVASLDTEFRIGIDVMTTETTCLSSIWQTDEETKSYLSTHLRPEAYEPLQPGSLSYYDGCVRVNLAEIKPMIALPFHPSNVYEIDELNANLEDILVLVEKEAERFSGTKAAYTLRDKITADGRLQVQQGVIAGCAGGTYSNIMEAAQVLSGSYIGTDEFYLSVYPSSQPIFLDLDRKGAVAELMASGAIIRSAFCGPCFGAGDTPRNNSLSVRHTTRNFPSREGSKPGAGQMSGVALMDARSIAVTAANGGLLTPATAFDGWEKPEAYHYDDTPYQKRVYYGYGKADPQAELIYGPNIKDWPEMSALTDNILLRVCSKILDPVTTTDELIPSGETSSFRSNPLGLAEFALSRRDPEYVGRAKAVDSMERARQTGALATEELTQLFDRIRGIEGMEAVRYEDTEIGSMVYAIKPGDGSAREQAASVQRVLGGLANICKEYATKRYRSNVINWGMLPFQMAADADDFEVGDYIFVPGIRAQLDGDMKEIAAYVLREGGADIRRLTLYIADMTPEEREIVKAGSLINYNKARMEAGV